MAKRSTGRDGSRTVPPRTNYPPNQRVAPRRRHRHGFKYHRVSLSGAGSLRPHQQSGREVTIMPDGIMPGGCTRRGK